MPISLYYQLLLIHPHSSNLTPSTNVPLQRLVESIRRPNRSHLTANIVKECWMLHFTNTKHEVCKRILVRWGYNDSNGGKRILVRWGYNDSSGGERILVRWGYNASSGDKRILVRWGYNDSSGGERILVRWGYNDSSGG